MTRFIQMHKKKIFSFCYLFLPGNTNTVLMITSCSGIPQYVGELLKGLLHSICPLTHMIHRTWDHENGTICRNTKIFLMLLLNKTIHRSNIRDSVKISCNIATKPYSWVLSKLILDKMSDFQQCLLIFIDIKIFLSFHYQRNNFPACARLFQVPKK